ARSPGGSRRYSLRHIEQLREVARLSAEGVSLPAISRIMALEEHVRGLQNQVSALEERVRTELANRPGARVFAAGATGQVIPVRSGHRIRRPPESRIWRPDPAQRRGAKPIAARRARRRHDIWVFPGTGDGGGYSWLPGERPCSVSAAQLGSHTSRDFPSDV